MNDGSGIKIALPGYDARSAPDYDLSFSSNWPMEQIAKTFSHTITSADFITADPSIFISTATLTFTHNLNFFAFADVWVYGYDTNFGGTVAYRLNSQNGYQFYMGKISVKIPTAYSPGTVGDSSTVYYFNVGDTISIKVYSFDFSKPFEYTAISPPVGASEYDPHVGIKIVRPGRDINSTDLRDFIFHSKGSAPQILTVQTLENGSITKTTSGSSTTEVVTYQIPFNVPARLDFLFSTDATSWKTGTGFPTWGNQVLETTTNVAYYATVYGQYDTQAVGDVSYTLSNSGLFTSFGLYYPVPFSVIIRRDPLLYSAPTEITI